MEYWCTQAVLQYISKIPKFPALNTFDKFEADSRCGMGDPVGRKWEVW